MRFSIEAWAPEYGSATETTLGDPSATVDATVERPLSTWEPVTPAGPRTGSRTILFTDGVRRVDARVWIDDGNGSRLGICASYAAGAILCDGKAKVVAADVQRGLFTPAGDAEAIVCRHAAYPVRSAPGDTPEQLALGLQQRMAELEVHLASAHAADLVVIDGPLSGRQNIPGAVGYVKTHHVSYLQGGAERVVTGLAAGQRTPLFLTRTSWSRFSWYLRLPCPPGHPWAGIVRCEASADQEVAHVVALADAVTAELPRFASCAHKDTRAPQNLYPIAGLERELRRRLGDPAYLYRSLLVAAATAN
ncbi:MAG: hypothetical protein ABR575_00175 [Actinomycetota bacterium]